MDFTQWRAHMIARDESDGVALALLDGNGNPVCDLPPVVPSAAPATRLSPSEFSVTIPARGRLAPLTLAAEKLLLDTAGEFDEQGYLAPAVADDFLVVVVQAGVWKTFLVQTVRASGQEAGPEEMTISGVSLESLLEVHPCPSIPSTWSHTITTADGGEVERLHKETGDAAVTYATPRLLAPVELTTRATRYAVRGPAVEVIRRVIQDSFDAVNALMGWEDPHIVVDFGVESPAGEEVTIMPEDGYLWETVTPAAESAGVNISVDMWFPGGPPIMVRPAHEKPPAPKSFPHPVARVSVEEVHSA